ncbi:hypothetical protein B0H19DRAFT_1073245 [Mycena capillaripes]|nr:hypothetical protein B0H19DRAFT_1073245 [Mycena capillaripes]
MLEVPIEGTSSVVKSEKGSWVLGCYSDGQTWLEWLFWVRAVFLGERGAYSVCEWRFEGLQGQMRPMVEVGMVPVKQAECKGNPRSAPDRSPIQRYYHPDPAADRPPAHRYDHRPPDFRMAFRL